MARLFTILGVALFLGAVAGPARAESPWDDARSVLSPNARFSSTLHATEVPDTLRLCHPVGKTCPSAGSLGGFPGGTAVTTAYGVAVDGLRLGFSDPQH